MLLSSSAQSAVKMPAKIATARNVVKKHFVGTRAAYGVRVHGLHIKQFNCSLQVITWKPLMVNIATYSKFLNSNYKLSNKYQTLFLYFRCKYFITRYYKRNLQHESACSISIRSHSFRLGFKISTMVHVMIFYNW